MQAASDAPARAKAPVPPWRKRKFKVPAKAKAADGLDTRSPQFGLNIQATLQKGEELLKKTKKLQQAIATRPWRRVGGPPPMRGPPGKAGYTAPTGKAPAIAASTLRAKPGVKAPQWRAKAKYGAAPGAWKAPPPKGPPPPKAWSWRSVPAKAVVSAVKRLGSKASPKQKAVAQAAAGWLAKKGVGSRNMQKGASLATEYFKPKLDQDGSDAAKAKTGNKAPRFAPALLEQTPNSLQTCQSLLLFISKRLAADTEEGPTVDAPSDARTQIQEHADSWGRLEGIKTCDKWDARARRIFNLGAFLATDEGKQAVKEATAMLEAGKEPLETRLSQGWDKTLEELLPQRREWAAKHTQRDWLTWLKKLLQAREDALKAG
eukprot:CAMPEP_0178439532 /NCGR_PEP_ID=MMETSP0689_2-20121128/36210_1 /TAXON_ID=160604 /ORGANISM="Amphidinium massartii, Strain CS-259" /LENGTH=374 /DNA_ID=CAMNT_0020062075 /DNA_START=91 /DNA_END=1212 /DNA_ORIENTATION=+